MTALRWFSLLLWMSGLLLSVTGAAAQPATATGPVLVGEIKGIINPVMAGYVDRVLDNAEEIGAEAVVFRMDTPGGLADAMREINQRILASQVPVIVYVAPGGARAGSAGVYIAYAAHVAAMAPTTNIGSATPVAMGEGGEQELSEEMRNKVTNDAVAQIRALAEQRGRNAEWAELAVREGANLQASEALRQGVVDVVAPNLENLLQQIDGQRVQLITGEATLNVAEAPLREAEMTAVEQFLLTITNPTIAYILLSLGSLGLIVELYNPGSIFPGVLGGIALLLAFYALGTLPVNFAGLALMGFGLALFALEPFVASSGLLAGGGAIAFAFGSLLLIDVPESAEFLRVSLLAVAAVTGLLLVFAVVALTAILRSRRRRAVTGREGLVGAVGVARTELQMGKPGLVHVDGELWQADLAAGPPVQAGERVVVEEMTGLHLKVRAATSLSPTTEPTARPGNASSATSPTAPRPTSAS